MRCSPINPKYFTMVKLSRVKKLALLEELVHKLRIEEGIKHNLSMLNHRLCDSNDKLNMLKDETTHLWNIEYTRPRWRTNILKIDYLNSVSKGISYQLGTNNDFFTILRDNIQECQIRINDLNNQIVILKAELNV